MVYFREKSGISRRGSVELTSNDRTCRPQPKGVVQYTVMKAEQKNYTNKMRMTLCLHFIIIMYYFSFECQCCFKHRSVNKFEIIYVKLT